MALPNRSCLVNSTCPPMQRTDLPCPSAASLMGRGPHGLVGWEADLFFPGPQCEVLRGCFMIHNPQPYIIFKMAGVNGAPRPR